MSLLDPLSAENSADSGGSNVWRATSHPDSQADVASKLVSGHCSSLPMVDLKEQLTIALKKLDEKDLQLQEKDKQLERYKCELERRKSMMEFYLKKSLEDNGQAENPYEPVCPTCSENYEKLTECKQTMETEKQGFEEKIQSLETQKQQLAEQIETVKHGFKEELHCLEDQKKQLAEKIESLVTQKQQLDEKIEAETLQFEMKIQCLEAEKQQLTKKIQLMETERQLLTETNADLKTTQNELKIQVAVNKEKAKEYAKLHDSEMEKRLRLEKKQSTD